MAEDALSKYVAHRLDAALRFKNEIPVGVTAPDFELRSVNGIPFRLGKMRQKSNIVLIFGSLTCGATITQIRAGNPTLAALYRRYRPKGFRFLLVYSKEIHPGENLPQSATHAERLRHARQLKKDENVPFPILVDHIDNKVRNLYQAWPNSVFIINRDGLLVYKSLWADGPEIELVLKDLSAWGKAKEKNVMVRMCYSEKVVGLLRNPKISAEVHRRAGPEAVKPFAALLQKEGMKR